MLTRPIPLLLLALCAEIFAFPSCAESAPFSLENNSLRVSFESGTSLISSVVNKLTGERLAIDKEGFKLDADSFLPEQRIMQLGDIQ